MTDPRKERALAGAGSAISSVSEWLELRSFAKWVALAAVVGVLGGLAAVAYELVVHGAKAAWFGRVAGTTQGGLLAGANPALVLIVPTLGGLAVGIVVHLTGAERDGAGTDAVVRAFHRMKGRVRPRVPLVTGLTSTLTIGTGGSGGQEGPVSQIGAGIGSVVAGRLDLSDRDRRIFLMAGGSAGISAMFASPLGAALFVPEVMYRRAEFEGDAIIPCVVSSAVAYSTFAAILGEERRIGVPDELLERLSFGGLSEIAIYVVLGIACALVSWLFVHGIRATERLFQALSKVPRIVRPAIGGLLVGAIALSLLPIVEGHGVAFSGYSLAESAISGALGLKVLGILVAAKVVATAVTVGSGGAGGVFAPSLSLGAVTGAAVGLGAATLLPGLDLEPAEFALVGMGGFFAGVAKVPIAAVVMVSEMTGNYALLAPLMIVAVVHMTLSTRWSLYPSQVGGPVDSPAHTGDYIVDILQSLRVADILDDTTPALLVHENTTLRKTMRMVSDSRETHFPVVDSDGAMCGIFSLTDLRRIFLEHEVQDIVVAKDFMREQVATVTAEDSLHDVQRLFTRRAVSALPVVDADDPRRVVALLKRNDVGRAYTERLKELKASSGSVPGPRPGS
ncbi:MAG: chloride channel protein [Planctomycetota bacterium]